MNATLEDRLRRHYDERTNDLPTRGPGLLDASALIVQPTALTHRPNRAARISLLVGSIAAATIVGFVIVDQSSTGQPSTASVEPTQLSVSTSTDPGIQVIGPSETLPDTGDLSATPVTVAGDSPSDWYRVQPDLDIAWYQDASGDLPATLCWRTPAGSDCASGNEPNGSFPS